MEREKIKQLKKGTKLRPIKSVTQSNHYKLNNLKEIEFLREGVYGLCYFKIIKGSAYSSYFSSKSENDEIELNIKALELFIDNTVGYDIY